MEREKTDQQANTAPVRFRGSRIGFTKETERRVFFAMTLIMLAAGILYKTGVW